MSSPWHCQACSAVLPDNASNGLCFACRATAERTVTPSGSDPAPQHTAVYSDPLGPPGPADLAPLFPQLEILGLLGQGGMGTVCKARQPHLDRLVALKNAFGSSIGQGTDRETGIPT